MKGCKQCELFEYQQKQYQEQLKHFTTSSIPIDNLLLQQHQKQHQKLVFNNRNNDDDNVMLHNQNNKKQSIFSNNSNNNFINYCKHEKNIESETTTASSSSSLSSSSTVKLKSNTVKVPSPIKTKAIIKSSKSPIPSSIPTSIHPLSNHKISSIGGLPTSPAIGTIPKSIQSISSSETNLLQSPVPGQQQQHQQQQQQQHFSNITNNKNMLNSNNCLNAINDIVINNTNGVISQYQHHHHNKLLNNVSNTSLQQQQQPQQLLQNHLYKRSSSVCSNGSNCDTLSSVSALSPTKMPSPILPSPASLLVDSGRGSCISIVSSLNGGENLSPPSSISSSSSISSLSSSLSVPSLLSVPSMNIQTIPTLPISISSSITHSSTSTAPLDDNADVIETATRTIRPTTTTQILPPNGPTPIQPLIPIDISTQSSNTSSNIHAGAATASVTDRTIAAANFAQSFALLQPHFRNMFYAAQLFSEGYYQPAGPLIHSHVIAPPPTSQLGGNNQTTAPISAIKQISTPLDISSDSETHLQQPPQSTSAAESSDSDVLITGGDLPTFRYPSSLGGSSQNQSSQSNNNNSGSVAQQQLSVLATAQQQQQQAAAAAAAAAAYTRSMHQMHYPSAYPPGYYSPYHPGEVCYSAPYQPYFPATKSYSPAAAAAAAHHQYRRYQQSSPYYQPGPPPGPPTNEMYVDPTQATGSNQPQTSAQVAQTQQQQQPQSGSQLVPAGQALPPLPPPTQHMDHYPGPPSFYTGYSPGGGGGGSGGGGNNSQCFSRGLQPSYIEYPPTCPCPMQSCPKNVLTGPLIGSNNSNNLMVNNNNNNCSNKNSSSTKNNNLTNSSKIANTTVDMKLLNINNTMNSSKTTMTNNTNSITSMNNNMINNSLNSNVANNSNNGNHNSYHQNHHTNTNNLQTLKSNKGPVKNQNLTQNTNSLDIATQSTANHQHLHHHHHHMHPCKIEITEPPTIEMKSEVPDSIADDMISTANSTAPCINSIGTGTLASASSSSLTSHIISNKNNDCNINNINNNNNNIEVRTISGSNNNCRDTHQYENNSNNNNNNNIINNSTKTLSPPIKSYTVNDKLLELEREMTISPARGSTGLPTIPDSTEKAAIITPAAANLETTPSVLIEEQRIEPIIPGSQNCNLIGRKARIGKTMAREMMYGQAAAAVIPNAQHQHPHAHPNAQVFNQHSANLFLNHPSQFATPAESIIQPNPTDTTQLNHTISNCNLTANTLNASTMRFPPTLEQPIKTEDIKTEEDDVVVILDDEKQIIKIEEPDCFEIFDDKVETLSDDSMFKEDIKPIPNILTPSSGILFPTRRMKILETTCKSLKKSPQNSYKSLIKQAEPKSYLLLSRKFDKKDRFKFLKQSSKIGLKRRKLVLTEEQKQRLKNRKKARELEKRKLKEQQMEAKANEILNKQQKLLVIEQAENNVFDISKPLTNQKNKEKILDSRDIEVEKNITSSVEENDDPIYPSSSDIEEVVIARQEKLKTPLDLTIDLVAKGYFSEPELRSTSVLSKSSTATSCRKMKKSKKAEARSKSETNENKSHSISKTSNKISTKENCKNLIERNKEENPVNEKTLVEKEENEHNATSESKEKSLLNSLSSSTSLNKQKSTFKTTKLKSNQLETESSSRNNSLSPTMSDLLTDIPLAATTTTTTITTKTNNNIDEFNKTTFNTCRTEKTKSKKKKSTIKLSTVNGTKCSKLSNSPHSNYSESISADTNHKLSDSETISNNNNDFETNNNDNKLISTTPISTITATSPTTKETATIEVPTTNDDCSTDSNEQQNLGNLTLNTEFNSSLSVECSINDDKKEIEASNTDSSDNCNNNNNLTLPHSKITSTVVQNNSDRYNIDPLQYNPQFYYNHHQQQHQAQKRKGVRARFGNRKRRRHTHELVETIIIPRKANAVPKWNNGWSWEGEPFQGKVFLNSDDPFVIRTCYPAMRHSEGDIIRPKDCVLLRAGTKKNELPYVAKVAHLWENPEDGEMMMSLLWYYRPEHTEQGRQENDSPDEVFASRHRDHNSVACIEDKCYVLTSSEYFRYRRKIRAIEENIEETISIVPSLPNYINIREVPPSTNPEQVMFCRRVYDFRLKRLMKTN